MCYVSDKEKIVKSVGIGLPEGKVIKSLQEGESYKYLEISEREILGEMKLKVSTEYFKRLSKVLQWKLNGGNLVQGVTTWTVPLSRYTAALFVGETVSCRL